MMKIAGSGSGSISQRQESADPDPDQYQKVTGPQHRCIRGYLPGIIIVEGADILATGTPIVGLVRVGILTGSDIQQWAVELRN
jgi:hypothetical protein